MASACRYLGSRYEHYPREGSSIGRRS